jgi:predicted nucleic acid-binding protein
LPRWADPIEPQGRRDAGAQPRGAEVLVDTSVWIDHFRRARADLTASLESSVVVCHPFVIGELACGTLRHREITLALLRDLPAVGVVDHDTVLALIETHHLAGTGLGWVDMHLLASALLSRQPLWTLDKPLERAARKLGVARLLHDDSERTR